MRPGVHPCLRGNQRQKTRQSAIDPVEENHKGLLGQSTWPGSLRASVTAWPCLLISSQEGPLFPGASAQPRVARIMSSPCHEFRKDPAAPDPLKDTQGFCTKWSLATQHGALEQTNLDLSAPATRPCAQSPPANLSKMQQAFLEKH